MKPVIGSVVWSGSLRYLVRKPRHKWFAAPDRRCEDGWYGPHETIESAIVQCAINYGFSDPLYVAQGYKITKAKRDECGLEFDWQVDGETAIEVKLPNAMLKP